MNRVKLGIRLFAVALVFPVIAVSGCSTLLGGDITEKLLELDRDAAEEFQELKKGYCDLDSLGKEAADRIINTPADPRPMIISCPESTQI